MDKVDIGYLINIGISTCRLFKVHSDESLTEDRVISYGVTPENEGKVYFDKLIELIRSLVKDIPDNFLVKVIVDTKFAELFTNENELKEFIRKFYIQTNLYFNILTKSQTETNLSKLFGEIKEEIGIINIGGRYVDIMTVKNGQIDSISLNYSLKNVAAIKETKKMGELLSESDIMQIKKQIQRGIKSQLKNVNVSTAIILKDELSFMQEFDYPLDKENNLVAGHEYAIGFEDYKNSNHKNLFCINFKQKLVDQGYEKTKQERLYGFKYGHLLLETIFELINVQKVIPSDLLNIHGSVNSYIYNVVLSGSTNKEHAKSFFEAAEFVKKLGAVILSPQFTGKNQFYPITRETDYAHLKAIDDCDILFVCNKDGYIGETTACEIYYASALRKTIVFWTEPSDNHRLKCIPHEHWNNIKIVGVHNDE